MRKIVMIAAVFLVSLPVTNGWAQDILADLPFEESFFAAPLDLDAQKLKKKLSFKRRTRFLRPPLIRPVLLPLSASAM